MSCSEYTKARDKSWEILILQKIHEFPIKVTRICKAMGIAVMSYHQGADIIKQIKLTDPAKKSVDLHFSILLRMIWSISF